MNCMRLRCISDTFYMLELQHDPVSDMHAMSWNKWFCFVVTALPSRMATGIRFGFNSSQFYSLKAWCDAGCLANLISQVFAHWRSTEQTPFKWKEPHKSSATILLQWSTTQRNSETWTKTCYGAFIFDYHYHIISTKHNASCKTSRILLLYGINRFYFSN